MKSHTRKHTLTIWILLELGCLNVWQLLSNWTALHGVKRESVESADLWCRLAADNVTFSFWQEISIWYYAISHWVINKRYNRASLMLQFCFDFGKKTNKNWLLNYMRVKTLWPYLKASPFEAVHHSCLTDVYFLRLFSKWWLILSLSLSPPLLPLSLQYVFVVPSPVNR